jgi:hypothetical protein
MKAFPYHDKALSFEKGMDLRDWFAGLAMQGIISNEGCSSEFTTIDAKIAYKMADEMMKAREQK